MKRVLLIFFFIVLIFINGCSTYSGSDKFIKQIAVGDEFTIFLTEQGEVYSVGNNADGNLGLGDTKPRYNPEKLVFTEKIKAIGAGEDCSYAISESGNTYFWGSNRYGQIGSNPDENQLLPSLLHIDSEIDEVVIGWNHSLAKNTEGKLYAWGSNEYYELGLGASVSSGIIDKPATVFVDFMENKTFNTMSAGATSSIAISEKGEVYVWGETGVRLIPGDEYITQASVPNRVEELTLPAIKTATGFLFELVLLEDGTVYGRGRNEYKQINSEDIALIEKFRQVPLPENIRDIVAGKNYAFAISSTGKAYAWGNNEHGQLGLEQVIIDRPTLIELEGEVYSISTFSTHSLIQTKNGDIYAMGNNCYGQLADGTQKSITKPTKVKPLSNQITNPVPKEEDATLSKDSSIVSLASGYAMSIAFDDSGNVYTWGTSFKGCLGNGEIDDAKAPTRLELPSKAVQVDTNTGITAILLDNGDMYMCGSNMNFRLGDGSGLDMWIPAKIDIQKPIKRFFNGLNATFAQTKDGDWYVWGDNSSGVLATGDLIKYKKPIRIDIPFNVIKISSHNQHGLILEDNGVVYSWGSWKWKDTMNVSDLILKKVELDERVTDIIVSSSSNFILTESGEIYAWGDNSDGGLGLSELRTYDTPSMITTDIKKTFTKIAVSPVFGQILALTSEGDVYTWGYDVMLKNKEEGSDVINIPLKVDLPEPVVDIYAGDLTAYAVSEIGTIYTWGGMINSPDGKPVRHPIKMLYNFKS